MCTLCGYILCIRKTCILKKFPPNAARALEKLPALASAGKCWPALASAVGNKNHVIRFLKFQNRYNTIFIFPNKEKSGPLGAAGSSVPCWPVLASASGCWSAGALGALSGTGNRFAHNTRFPDVNCTSPNQNMYLFSPRMAELSRWPDLTMTYSQYFCF